MVLLNGCLGWLKTMRLKVLWTKFSWRFLDNFYWSLYFKDYICHQKQFQIWDGMKMIALIMSLRHVVDSLACKKIDKLYASLASETRNVRLGSASDGFYPFGNISIAHSIWPIILVPYNLLPWMFIKKSFFMLSLLIPGPHEDILLKNGLLFIQGSTRDWNCIQLNEKKWWWLYRGIKWRIVHI